MAVPWECACLRGKGVRVSTPAAAGGLGGEELKGE